MKALSENLLNEVTTMLENEIMSELENKECTLMEDGWSNIHNEPVIATCLRTDGKAYFLNAEECRSNKKHQIIVILKQKNLLKIAEEKYETKVIAVVTDNDSEMDKLRQLLLE